MRRWFLVVVLAALGQQASAVGTASMQANPRASVTTRDRQSFDFEWRFRAGDVEGAQAMSANDASWETVDLPHDFMLEGKGQAIVVPGGRAGGGGNRGTPLPEKPEGPFDPRSPGGNSNGYLNGGLGWYR